MAGGFDQPNDRWRRWVRGGFGMLALAGFVGVLWYAYEWGLGGGETVELPTVTADAGPEKVKPSDPGGLQVPYQDQLVLNQDGAAGSAPRVERLLPPPESPLPPLTAIAPSYDELPPAAPSEDETGATAGETGPLQPAGETPAAEPEAARTIPELPAAPGATAAPQTPAAETQTAETKTAEAPAAAPEPAPEPTAPEPAATQSTATQSTATQSAAAQPAATSAADSGGLFAVQLVSLKDAGAAEREWGRLQGVFPQLLGDTSLLLQSAEVAGVGKVYRLRAGPFVTRDKAAKVCAQLKSKQQDCLVVNR
jgi:cell division protein FtsN